MKDAQKWPPEAIQSKNEIQNEICLTFFPKTTGL
jgi:hypothetical protein